MTEVSSELADGLQAALGSSYALERELGGGGMSRVFLATETALGRPVVLKVLPPEMAAAVNIERFRREIRLAASLQHPHVVPLHAAGQAGDLLYYSMPLVEGESLRAKLAREGELPVGEAIRIMRDVAEALAYAHDHGVVHRDIKPDNILISGHHAVVTDFGVAKAVSAASGSSSLTSLGIALGTPAYMAPEQAAADPHVDHRADLYALGAVGYEMLCGRPPFVGMTPQQVLAAQVTHTPEPCTAHRAAVPAALAALVMRCLEKKPADRVQRAEDLAAQLEAMATPSGGMAPTAATPAVSRETRGPMRVVHPAKVAALFGLASLAALAAVYGLMIHFGLPGWVFGGAVVLLAIGLPIMLLTGRREGERALARASGSAPPATASDKWLTWRRALVGGVLAFGALGVVTAGYMAMRVLGIGPAGTLVAAGVLSDKQRILLADFENRAADTTLGPTLTEAFRVDLAQSPTVQLEDAAGVGEALVRMKREARAALTPALAREVAEREGIKAIVTGEIDPVGAGYVLSANVLAASDGRVLTAVRETAANQGALIPALDQLSKALRERIGESLTTIRANEPLADVTTSSLDALRKYTAAIRLADAQDYEGAIPLLEAATQEDTGFAMAYRKLAVMLSNTFGSSVAATAAATQAFAHRDRLPELERDQAEAYYHWQVNVDLPKATAAYRAVLELRPTDQTGLINLGLVMEQQGQFTVAESLFTKAIAVHPGQQEYTNLADAQGNEGRYAALDSSVATMQRLPSAGIYAGAFSYIAAGARRDFAGAERIGAENLNRAPPRSSLRQLGMVFMADVSTTRGRLAEAEQRLHAAMATAEDRGLPGQSVWIAARLADIDIRYRDRRAAALATVTAALQQHPLASIPATDRPYSELARLYVATGRVDEARRLLSEYDRAVPDGHRRGDREEHAAEGDIAFADGRASDAIRLYHAYHDAGPCPSCGLFEIAQVYQKTGAGDSAIAYYTRAVDAPGTFRTMVDVNTLAASYQRLGELYEQRGDRAKAIDYYGRLIDLWNTADPDLQPIIRDVHGRLARLSAEH